MIHERESLTIQGWMITDHELSGAELIAFAVIFSGSQDGASICDIEYVYDWVKTCSGNENIFLTAINDLKYRNLIVQEENEKGTFFKINKDIF